MDAGGAAAASSAAAAAADPGGRSDEPKEPSSDLTADWPPNEPKRSAPTSRGLVSVWSAVPRGARPHSAPPELLSGAHADERRYPKWDPTREGRGRGGRGRGHFGRGRGAVDTHVRHEWQSPRVREIVAQFEARAQRTPRVADNTERTLPPPRAQRPQRERGRYTTPQPPAPNEGTVTTRQAASAQVRVLKRPASARR